MWGRSQLNEWNNILIFEKNGIFKLKKNFGHLNWNEKGSPSTSNSDNIIEYLKFNHYVYLIGIKEKAISFHAHIVVKIQFSHNQAFFNGSGFPDPFFL